MISKGIMETSLELIRFKISELEARIANLHIAERELLALDKRPVQQDKRPVQQAKAAPKAKSKSGRQPKQKPEISAPAEKIQTMSAAVSQVLAEHEPLAVAEIAGFITATGRDAENRAISFTLQALKKRGLVKNVDGKWTAAKVRSKKTQAVTLEA
jgi:hypothetical protein